MTRNYTWIIWYKVLKDPSLLYNGVIDLDSWLLSHLPIFQATKEFVQTDSWMVIFFDRPPVTASFYVENRGKMLPSTVKIWRRGKPHIWYPLIAKRSMTSSSDTRWKKVGQLLVTSIKCLVPLIILFSSSQSEGWLIGHLNIGGNCTPYNCNMMSVTGIVNLMNVDWFGYAIEDGFRRNLPWNLKKNGRCFAMDFKGGIFPVSCFSYKSPYICEYDLWVDTEVQPVRLKSMENALENSDIIIPGFGYLQWHMGTSGCVSIIMGCMSWC